MIQLTALSQKISLLVVLSLLSTLLPGPTPLAGIGQAVKIDSPSFISPLPTPMPPPQAATFTSPLPTPLAPAPMLGLTVWAEPVGGAPGEIVTLTLRLDNPTETALSGVTVRVTLPDSLHRLPDRSGWAYDAREKQLSAGVGDLAPGAGITLTLALRAAAKSAKCGIILTAGRAAAQCPPIGASPASGRRCPWASTTTARGNTIPRWDGSSRRIRSCPIRRIRRA